MPIYEYRCASCGAELEKLQKISDPPLRECPECGRETLVKRVSASGFRLKGSGWYETDFKTGKKKHGVETDAGNTGNKDSNKTEGHQADAGKADTGKPDTGKAGAGRAGLSKTAGNQAESKP